MESHPLPKIPTVADLGKELNEPPDFRFDPPSAEDLAAANEPLPPTELDADKALHDLDFTGDYKKLFQSVAHVYGLDCVYDSDYQPGNPTRFRMKDVDYRDALHGLEAVTGSFVVPVTSKIFLVAKDTAQKRTEIEPTVTMSVRFPDTIAQQELEQMVRAVQQAMAIEKLGVDATAYTVVMKDRISKVVYARALFQQLMHGRAQVLIDLRFVEVSRNDSITYGINFPSIFSLNALTNFLNNTVSLPSSVQGVLTFGGAKTLIGLGISGPALVAQLSNSSSNLLLASQLRTVSGQKATLHIGQKYPILTGAYGGGTAPVQGSLTIAPSFTFQDLGLTMTATPVVHDRQEVSLDVEAEYQVLTGASLNGLPVISNRQFKNITRLQFGEWSIIAGLLTTNEARTLSGLAGPQSHSLSRPSHESTRARRQPRPSAHSHAADVAIASARRQRPRVLHRIGKPALDSAVDRTPGPNTGVRPPRHGAQIRCRGAAKRMSRGSRPSVEAGRAPRKIPQLGCQYGLHCRRIAAGFAAICLVPRPCWSRSVGDT
ncbi:MAG: hypothetical protein WDO73_12475 [Ignavibacteriota bacterium]